MNTDFSLLVKYLSQNLSFEEREELDNWCKITPENKQIFTEARDLRLLDDYLHRDMVQETARALSGVWGQIEKRKYRYRLIEMSKYAAAFILIVFIGIYGWINFSSEKYTTVVIAENENVKKVVLSDSSLVWLSASSELRIPKSFNENNRQLYLKGRAFFEIKKNSASPFLVRSDLINVKVTGTSFDLLIDDKSKTTETVLASGKVTLQNKKGENVIEMTPGESVVYDACLNRYTISTVDVKAHTSWYLDQITFENATLREIVNKLSVIYDVNINLESAKLADHRFRYVINREETLVDVLDLLCYLAPIGYHINKKEVFITEQTLSK